MFHVKHLGGANPPQVFPLYSGKNIERRYNMVKLKVCTAKKYEVYKFENGSTELLAIEETNGERLHEVDMCKKYNAKKVVLNELKNERTYDVYTMTEEDFKTVATKEN